MTQWLGEVFSNIFGDNVILATILISIIPIIELRGAIPFATNTGFWGSLAQGPWSAYLWSLIGTSAVVPLLALIFLPIINYLKKTKWFGRLARFIENYFRGKAGKLNNLDNSKKSYWKKMLGVFIFVAIPLPLTGVYTGTCVALLIGLDYLSTCLVVMLGNALAGVFITLILIFFPALNNYLFYIFLGLVVLFIIGSIIYHEIMKRKNTNEGENI